MRNFILYSVFLLITATIFFYLGYEPEPHEIDLSGILMGYQVQTTQYTLYGLMVIFLLIISLIARFIVGIKNLYHTIFYFFVGRSKEKATENLLNAYAFTMGRRPKTALNYLRKAEKYFKKTPHIAIIKLMINNALGQERPLSGAIAQLEEHKNFVWLGAYIERIYKMNHQDLDRLVTLLSRSENATEDRTVCYDYFDLLLTHKSFDTAEATIRAARSILSEDEFKMALSNIYFYRAILSSQDKKPDQTLNYALESLKHKKDSFVLFHALQAYKILQRDNKAIRLLDDYFSQEPKIFHILLFLDLKNQETTEQLGRRIASLPRAYTESRAFIALQMYYFALSRDFSSLNNAITKSEKYSDDLWFKAAKLCMVVEKDKLLFTQVIGLFKEALQAASYQEFCDQYNPSKTQINYLKYLTYQENIITTPEVTAKLALFKQLLKSIPVISNGNATHQISRKYNQSDLYRLEGSTYNDDEV